MKEEKELSLEELQDQLKELQAKNADLKAKLEGQPEQPEQPENKEEIEVEEVVAEDAPADDDKETALQTRLEALWKREVQIELKASGLEAFSDFIQVEVDDSENLQAKIKQLKAIIEETKLSDSYQPRKTAVTVDEFARAKAKGDPVGMLRAKLS